MEYVSAVESVLVQESQVASLGMRNSLSIALPKGRLLQPSIDALEKAGLQVPGMDEIDRRLVYATGNGKVRFILVRPADVPIYVEHGAADLGVTGKDVLLEGDRDVCELLDLGFGRCRLVVAALGGMVAADAHDPESLKLPVPRSGHILRAATKFPTIARRHFAPRPDLCVEIIKLNGAVEIAPIAGLSDVIVDIVDTGRTLADNGLVPVEEIMQVSARLIANRASLQLKAAAIHQIALALRNNIVNHSI